MKKLLLITLVIMISISAYAQVGIGNTAPEAALDITSANSGILIPRVALTSNTDITTVTNPNTGLAPITGTLVFNNGTLGLTEVGFYHWNGMRWNKLIDEGTPSVYFGSFIINSNATGSRAISGIPFQPKRVILQPMQMQVEIMLIRQVP